MRGQKEGEGVGQEPGRVEVQVRLNAGEEEEGASGRGGEGRREGDGGLSLEHPQDKAGDGGVLRRRGSGEEGEEGGEVRVGTQNRAN